MGRNEHMQINGVGNNQIGNSYQNPNRMPNSTMGKKEDEDINKRLEALGVKVELSFQQTGAQEQETAKETVETEKTQDTFSVVGWIKKIWDAGIAWLKSIWNDEQSASTDEAETEMFDADVELVDERPVDADADYTAMHAKTTEVQQGVSTEGKTSRVERFDFRVADEEIETIHEDKYRTVGTALHTSGMQDSYNRYGQHSKLGVEPSNNMQVRK